MVLHLAHERLLQVQLECLPYQEILKRYDRQFTFFYLDPPYFGLPYYRFNFEEKDYVELAGLLNTLKGKFLLSLNDTPEVRQIFAAFNISGLSFSYSAQSKPGRKHNELLISNYSHGGSKTPVSKDISAGVFQKEETEPLNLSS
jgi:DNA adenine methylase